MIGMIGIAKEFDKGMLRAMIESFLDPLTKEGGPFDRLGRWLSGLFEGLTKNIGAFFKDVSNATLKIAGAAAGIRLGIAGTQMGGVKGAISTIGGAGLAGL
jgi:hypothetical protein